MDCESKTSPQVGERRYTRDTVVVPVQTAAESGGLAWDGEDASPVDHEGR